MRVLINFSSKNEIKSFYNLRSCFISFIKKTFEVSNHLLYNILFEKKKAKPYVFSPYFGEEFKKEKIGKNISMIFSTGDFSIISYFWNGLLYLKEKKLDFIEINGEKFFIKNVKLFPNKKINSNKVIFKTIGISVLTDPEKSADDFKNWYIIPEKENVERFNEVLKRRTEERIKFIIGVNRKINLKFSLTGEIENSVIETIIPHYKGYIRGFRGLFFLEGEIEALQFLYDYGFGVRTGQGFGLLEIVKEL
ncbi:MAG: CRISPR-associated endoribonuclease Cas6 [bacterium]|nr:CRISPR-associated endoribonuclease Cas6 [bacterium]MDW8163672.1 CRISPR-associated endoribonuclease Cas6 [Candidatus Omnitrophota bacterium]